MDVVTERGGFGTGGCGQRLAPSARVCRFTLRRVTYCEVCGLDRAHCAHAFAEHEAKRKIVDSATLLVSPRGVAHFDGCPHKGDDPDLSKWGRIERVPHAWQRLGNGDIVPANAGAKRDLIAKARCRDCDEHGPW